MRGSARGQFYSYETGTGLPDERQRSVGEGSRDPPCVVTAKQKKEEEEETDTRKEMCTRGELFYV